MNPETHNNYRHKKVKYAVAGVVGVVAASVITVNTWTDAYDALRQDEQADREKSVEEVLTPILGVKEVIEIDKDGKDVTATVVFGKEILQACHVTYSLNPNSNRTFEPGTLDYTECL